MARWRKTFWRKCSATCGVDKARDRLSRASPTFSAASLISLQSPDTMTSIARRTRFEMRFAGAVTSAGGGLSSVARARLAGGFSMFAIIGDCRRLATHQNVTFCRALSLVDTSEGVALVCNALRIRGIAHVR